MKFYPKHATRAGFALLMASLVSSVLLAIGTVIANIATKQVALSGTARESLSALYAADTGVECALYLDFRYNSPTAATFNPSQTTCGNQSLTISNSSESDSLPGETWKVFSINNAGACATVSVGKSQPASEQIRTRVRARGYNTCDTGFSRRVERALQVEY